MNLHVNCPPNKVLVESVSFLLHLGNEVEVLSAVDVEVGGAVERHEEVGDVGDALDPGRPRALVVHGEAEQLVDVGDPLHRVAHDEDEHDRQRDLRKGKGGDWSGVMLGKKLDPRMKPCQQDDSVEGCSCYRSLSSPPHLPWQARPLWRCRASCLLRWRPSSGSAAPDFAA